MPHGDRGFSLIEVIVALAVFAAAASAVYSGLGQSWRAQRQSERTADALLIAQNAFASAGASSPLDIGKVVTGHDRGVAWQMTVEAASSAAPSDGTTAPRAPAAYWLVFDASWPDLTRGQPHGLRLRALKIGPEP